MKSMNLRSCRLSPALAVLLLLAAMLLPSTSVNAQAIKAEEATEADGAVFQNDRARQHMLELEQRMFRLAELLKESQPEDAQRLTMGVKKSREMLVVQRMSSVSELIAGLDLSEASTKVEGIIVELKAIKKLLLTADLDAEIDKERLRQINAALEALDNIAKQEGDNKGQSDKLAEDAKDGKPSPAAMKGVGDAEDRNKEATDRLAEKVGDINPADPNLKAAKDALGKASKSMGKASKSMGEGKPGEASDSQGKAKDDLDKAKKDLEKARDELRKKLEAKIRSQVLDNLNAMLKQQVEIREQLEQVSERADSGDSRAIVQVRGLVQPEKELITLANDTIDLCEQTAFSIAMPAALSAVRDRMIYLVDDYSAGLGGATVVQSTIRVEEDLKSLIEAMELSNDNQKPKDPQDPKNQDPREKEKREVNQILAELRMLRIMQIATNENVTRLEQTRLSGDLPAATLATREEMVSDQQDRVRSATAALREKAMNSQ